MRSYTDFDTIYNAYFTRIKTYLTRLIGPFHAEDAAQTRTSLMKIKLHRSRQMLKRALDQGCTFYRDGENRLLCDRKSLE